ncbi:hypothetical protein [Novosphingobium kaempferiae]|uniref:hypothetical protein n=1 Tax=Novosphingobium kaempferiae TaxID=2896849 RepID=UPI001E597F8D|nr:hypothetical protein [Novosphingobium kaempferiae]
MHLRLPAALSDSVSDGAASLGMSRPEYVRHALRAATEGAASVRSVPYSPDPIFMAMLFGPDYKAPPQDISIPAKLHDRLIGAAKRRGLPFATFLHQGLSALANEPAEIRDDHADDDLLAFVVAGNVGAILELAQRTYDAPLSEGVSRAEQLAVVLLLVQLAAIHPNATPTQRLLSIRRLGAAQYFKALDAEERGANAYAHEMAANGMANLDRAADQGDEESAELISILASDGPSSVPQRARQIRQKKD